MKYRVVKKSDGQYHLQYRFCFIFWSDSAAPSLADKDGAIDKAKRMEGTNSHHIIEKVWP